MPTRLIYCLAFVFLGACTAPVELTNYAEMGQDDAHFAFVHRAAPRVYLLPNSVGSAKPSVEQKIMLNDVLREYHSRFNASIRIIKPTGGVNDYKLGQLTGWLRGYLRRNGVSLNRISVVPQVAGPDENARLELQIGGFVGVSPQRCGYWRDDLATTMDFSHYPEFGCAVQNNLAVQMLQPREQFVPRRSDYPDAGRIARILGDYRANGSSGPSHQPSVQQ
ncbi:CpaD family pilus assembly lipoprotein [Brucella intermedia]|uniref:CpaD family pilus assembly lipoprotein n=1 Tax=Brucella intermedia TaxID=94625 RepID=UPI00138E04A8|nr:CpaD family pilus assembly lipoprotein [Brucella intermedia]